MTTIRNRYLVRRGERWYYFRRIPKRYALIDARTYSKAALNTDSLTVARERRDVMADADENLWDAALAELGNNTTPEVAKVCRYRSAQRRAQAIGVLFKPADYRASHCHEACKHIRSHPIGKQQTERKRVLYIVPWKDVHTQTFGKAGTWSRIE